MTSERRQGDKDTEGGTGDGAGRVSQVGRSRAGDGKQYRAGARAGAGDDRAEAVGH